MRIAVVLGAAVLLVAAQDRPETVIRTTTRVVQIRVMAENSHGDPVTDLRQDELQLTDNRKPRRIDFLTFEGIAPATSKTGSQPAPNQSDDIRNDYAVILLDWLNPNFIDRLRVRDYVYKLLKNFRPRQQVALYLLALHDSRLLHDFTSDPAELYNALANTEEEPEDPFDPAKPPLADPRYKTWATLTVDERITGFNRKVLDTIAMLNKLADGLGRIPGRKSVVWVTNGFPILVDNKAVPGIGAEKVNYGQSIEPAIDRLNRSNVALYTVDPRGLSVSGGYGDVDTLHELSERTGASAFAGRNDIDEGMRLAFEDGQSGYTLGFTLESDAPVGIHDIRIRAIRPGVKLRYRESYQWDGR